MTRAERRRVVRFSAGDAVRLLGVEFGRGPNGIVLAHQGGGGAPGNLCAWVPYARRLARAGHHVLVFDHRAHGSSDLPSSGRRAEQVDLDVVAAVRILRRRGATAIVLGGASLGGTAVLAAAARIEPAVQGVFSIAAPLVFGPSDGLAAVRTLALPALFMSAAEDGTFAEEARELYAACPSAQKRLEIVPGTEHGAPVLRSASARTLVDTWIGERFAATPSRSTAAGDQTPADPFAYDASEPLGAVEVGRRLRGAAVVKDVTFASARERVRAFVVLPARRTPTAGVLFLHGYAGRNAASRDQFVGEAVTLAGAGVASVLPSGFFPWLEAPSALERDRQFVTKQVIQFRRAIDLLREQVGASARLAVVGHDFGAMYAAILAGADHRAASYVIMAGTPAFPDWFNIISPGVATTEYRSGFVPLNPITWIRSASQARVLFQFGRQDGFVSRARANAWFRAATGRKEIRFYTAGHELNSAARTYRLRWVRARLGVRAP